MGTTMIVLEVLVGVAFLGSGGLKLTGNAGPKGDFKRFGYPVWLMHVTGVLEITGAVGMFAGIFAPVWGALAGLLLAAVISGAIFSHVRAKDPASKLAPPSVLLVLTLAVSAIYFFV